MLNELSPGMEGVLAPTDCRLRPDIRAMENGDIGKYSFATFNFIYLYNLSGHCHGYLILFSPHAYVLDTASQEKERLEEKQRAARRERTIDEEEWSTR